MNLTETIYSHTLLSSHNELFRYVYFGLKWQEKNRQSCKKEEHDKCNNDTSQEMYLEIIYYPVEKLPRRRYFRNRKSCV